MSNRSSASDGLQLHHAVALLGLGVVLGGLFLGWQTTHDAAEVDAALAGQQTAGELDQRTSLRRAQILFLREARQRRLRNTSLLVIGVGLFGIVGAALLGRVRSEIVAWGEVEVAEAPDRSDDEDPPTRRHAA